MEAMIGEEHYDGILGELQAIEFVNHLADLRVRIARARVISVPQLHGLLTRERPLFGDPAVSAQFWPVVERDLWSVPRRSVGTEFWYLCAVIHIPILFRRAERQMRFAKAHCQEKRLTACLQFP